MLLVFILILSIYNSETSSSPNIVFFLADDLGFNDVSYHNSRVITPMLDRLARSGVILENYYSQPVGIGTRASLLTGRYPIHIGFQNLHSLQPDWELGLPLNFTLLPEKLRGLGYKTHIVGKWHLGHHKKEYLPTARGFDTHFGYYTSALDNFKHTSWDVYPHPSPVWALDLHNSTGNSTQCVSGYNGTYSLELYRYEAVRLIESHDVSKPLFLYLPIQSVHQPNQIPESYAHLYSQMETLDRRVLLETMSMVDGLIWEVYHALQKKGKQFWENTIIIFTSDNGSWPIPSSTGNNSPLRGGKYTLFEGGVRVPTFVYSPLIRNKGREEWSLFHCSDWYPTLLKLAGARESEYYSLDGFDQWSVISEGVKDGTFAKRIEILHNIETDAEGVVTSAIRYGAWKLVTGKWGSCTAYSDPYYCSWIPSPPTAEYIYFSSEEESDNNPEQEAPALPGDVEHQFRISNRYYSPLLLFHLSSDHKERRDLSNLYPNLTNLLLNRLDNYYDSMESPLVIRTSNQWKETAIENQCLVPWCN